MNDNFCPKLKIDQKSEEPSGVTLRILKYLPTKKVLHYGIEVVSEKVLINLKEMYPNIYGVWNDFQSAQPINTVKLAYLSQLCLNLAYFNLTKQSVLPLEVWEMPESIRQSPFTQLGPFFIFIMLIMAVLLIREVCIEKEVGIHTYMITMGLPRFTFYLSHLIFAVIKFYLFLAVTLGMSLWLMKLDGLFFVASVALLANVMIGWILMTVVLCYRSIYAILLLTVPVLIMFAAHLGFIGQQVLFYSTRAVIYSLVNPITAFMLILYHMDFTRGINEKVHYFDNFDNYLPIGIPAGILLLQSIILLILAFYFDYVLPLDNLPKEHPLFFLQCCQKQKQSENENNELGSLPRNSLNIKNLVKRWPNADYAVNKISLSVKIGECTALLGHNGAGKSTVFGCLTGFLKPTSGTIEFPQSDNFVSNRKVGYCPQWNPLFPKLSVAEHLSHYCEFLTGHEPTKNEIKKIMTDIELYNERHTRAENLSGGMKRKLSLGIALISNAKVILLDEPTSGMDIIARKNTFRMIEKAKETRAILLTTHYMDEADKLADDIVIMVRGHIVAHGKGDDLKQKFGADNVLIVHFDFPPKRDRDIVTAAINAVLIVVQKHCPLAIIDETIGNHVYIRLTAGTRPEFTVLFAELEQRKAELSIASFNFKTNTLDQVFINITDKTENVKDRIDPSQVIREFISCHRNVSTGSSLFFCQFYGLAMRKWQNTRRDYIQPMLLLLCVILVAAAMAYFHFKRKGPVNDSPFLDESLALSDYQKMSIAMYGSSHENFENGLYNQSMKHEYLQLPLDNNTKISNMENSRFLLPPRGLAYFFETNVSMYFNKGFPNGPFFGINAYFQALMPNQIMTNLRLKIISIKDTDNVLKASGNSLDPSLVALMVMCLVFPVIFAIPAFLYADERFSGAINLYKRTKTSYFIYWLIGFFTDVIMCGVVVAVIMGFIYIFDGFSHHILLHLSIGIALTAVAFLAQCYAVSLILSSGAVTFAMLIVINVLMFFALQKGIETVEFYIPFVKFAIFVFPSLAMHNYFDTVFKNSGRANEKAFLDLYECPAGKLCEDPLLVLGVCGFLNLVIFACVILTPWKRLFHRHPRAVAPVFKSEDIVAEQTRCDVQPVNNFAIVSKYLRKDFGKRIVVREFSVGIEKCESFGLLGVNGAGKSTVFGMLSCLIRPSDGKAFVDSVNVLQNPKFGYCPQINAMLQNLTVFETMQLFARLNGNKRVNECAHLILKCLRLTLKRHNLIKHCSGGEKRRVSIGIALMTNPSILMLDEPTAGVDPHTRRYILDTLLTIKAFGGAVFITSHSLEECELLCSRIGFLVEGCLVAIGTTQHLKELYDDDYLITVIITEENKPFADRLHELITAKFQAMLIGNTEGTRLYWKLKNSNTSMPLLNDDLESVLRDVCSMSEFNNVKIADFSITKMSLEDALIAIGETKPVPNFS